MRWPGYCATPGFPATILDPGDRESATSNLARLAEAAFERRGDYESLLFEGRWYGSAELFSRACRLGAGLRALGIEPGERVVVSMANRPEVSMVYQAVWRAGAVVTPATFLLTPEDLRHVIADSRASAVITTSEFVDKVGRAVAGLDDVRHVISTDGAGDGVIPLSDLEQAEPAAIVPRADDDLAALLYTGGTTGRAKGVMLSHANLNFAGKAVQGASHVPGVDRSLMTLPLSHSYGMLVTVSAMHSPERPVTVLLRWFDPAAFLALVQEHGLQTSAVVPSMIHLLLAQPLEAFDLSTLRYLGCGAAPLAPKVAEEIERRIPSMTVRQGYGLTETAALISTNPVGHEKPGSVGLPIPGAVVRIVDEDGESLAAGEPGEICVRSPAVMQGYWGAAGRDRRGATRRVATHRRRRLSRRRGLLVRRRPQEGPDHPRRVQRLPPRRRGRAARAPGGHRRRRGRAPGRASRRGGGRVRIDCVRERRVRG